MTPAGQIVALLVVGLLAGTLEAQQTQPAPPTQPAPQTQPAPTQPAPQRRAQPRPTSVQVVVRDVSGTPLGGVKVLVSGPASLEATTDDKGAASLGALRDGSYRFRFELEGFVTLERDVPIRNGQPSEVLAALRIIPRPLVEPPPPPPPVVEAPPPPPPVPSGPPVFVSIPQFLEKNFIGREPLKETVFGCLPGSTTRLLQLHEAIAEHTHSELDEILYVVAGEGTVRVRTESSNLAAGSLSVIPRGLPHAIEQRGRNPLIIISTVSGAPCTTGGTPQNASTTKK
jgi:Carboxypeptidase regulatory-like domain/Cupin domain